MPTDPPFFLHVSGHSGTGYHLCGSYYNIIKPCELVLFQFRIKEQICKMGVSISRMNAEYSQVLAASTSPHPIYKLLLKMRSLHMFSD